MKLRRAVAVAVIGIALSGGGAAWAHGELVATDPKAGERLGDAPGRISVTLSEPPTRDVVFRVKDGCDRSPVRDVTIEGDTIIASMKNSEPGKWRVRYRAISSVDGHVTAEQYGFTVRGKPDCTSEPTEQPDDEGDSEDDGLSGPTTPVGDDGDSLPLVPIALGAGGLVLIGVLVRVFSAR